MSTVIAFSGACHSGKTTAIAGVKEHFGEKVISVSECIRRRDDVKNIDAIRRDPNAYLNFQIEVITEKFSTEQQVISDNPNSIILTDRSMADSFFYYAFYVDKSNLNRERVRHYTDFFKWLYFRTMATVHCYDHIFLFKPIKIKENDPLRPGNLDLLQDVEYLFIQSLVRGFYQSTHITEVSAENELDMTALYSIIEAYETKS
jgi:hypothetical protein